MWSPRIEDRAALIEERKKVGINNLSDTARWHYHAYDYGWRRVVLGQGAPNSPIDPEAKWFNGPLADRAEEMWRRFFNRPKRDSRVNF